MVPILQLLFQAVKMLARCLQWFFYCSQERNGVCNPLAGLDSLQLKYSALLRVIRKKIVSQCGRDLSVYFTWFCLNYPSNGLHKTVLIFLFDTDLMIKLIFYQSHFPPSIFSFISHLTCCLTCSMRRRCTSISTSGIQIASLRLVS